MAIREIRQAAMNRSSSSLSLSFKDALRRGFLWRSLPLGRLPLLLLCLLLFAGCQAALDDATAGGEASGDGGSENSSGAGGGTTAGGDTDGSSPTPSGGTGSNTTPSILAVAEGGDDSDAEGVDNPNGTPESDYFYFTYDDSASVANVELAKNSLSNDRLPNPAWGVPYEFLNYEDFSRGAESSLGIFQVSIGIVRHGIAGLYEGGGDDNAGLSAESSTDDYYELGVSVEVPALSQEARKNFVLTFLVDVSGSMDAAIGSELSTEQGVITRLDLVKYSLEILYRSGGLKAGDIINLVQFNHASTDSDILLQELAYSSASQESFLSQVSSMQAGGSTNIAAGIDNAYAAAAETYDSSKTNRVIILTDAYANTGETVPAIIGKKTKIEDSEGIYFSGVGVGEGFNFSFLDQLTDLGKGSYFALFGTSDANRLFRDSFFRLIQVAAREVIFRLEYPSFLFHTQTASEDIAQNPEALQSVNFSYGSSQFFIETFQLRPGNSVDLTRELTFSIQYTDPVTEEQQNQELSMSLGSFLQDEASNMAQGIREAVVVRNFARLVSRNLECSQVNSFHSSFLDSYSSELLTEYLDHITHYCRLFEGTPYGESLPSAQTLPSLDKE